jgi:hypothetical protein
MAGGRKVKRFQEVLTVADREELDQAIGYMTTVSIDLENSGAVLRKSFIERFQSDGPAAVKGTSIPLLMSRLKPNACRLRGLLSWEHAWLRFVALALDEVQSNFFRLSHSSTSPAPKSRGEAADSTSAVSMPLSQIQFMAEKVADWKSELMGLKEEATMLFEGLKTAQSNQTSTEGTSDLTRSSLFSMCLQQSTQRGSSSVVPPILVEDPTSRRSDDVDTQSVVEELLENVGGVLQIKVSALIPVCQRLEQVIRDILTSSRQGDEVEEGDPMIHFSAMLSKPPLEECHKQFCMAV